MEKKEFPIMNDKDIQSSSIFQKTYNNIKNSLNNHQNIDYKGLKSIILNFIEQNFTGFHLKNKNITQDKLFLLIILQLSSDGIIQNNILMKLLVNKDIISFIMPDIYDMDGNVIEASNHPEEKIKFKLDKEVLKYDMMRIKR